MLLDERFRGKKFILIDDDPTFLRIMRYAAELEGFDLDVFDSFNALEGRKIDVKYDSILLDYDLGNENGIEIAEKLSLLLGRIPVILVSSVLRRDDLLNWPECIKMFAVKSCSYGQMLRMADECSRRRDEVVVKHSI